MGNEFKTQEELIVMTKSNESLMRVLKHLYKKFTVTNIYADKFTMNFDSSGKETDTLRIVVIAKELDWDVLKTAVHEVEPYHNFEDNCDPLGFDIRWDDEQGISEYQGYISIMEGIMSGLL